MFPYEMIDAIVSFVFSIQCILMILALIGAYALLWWSIENFKSIVQVIRSILVPYFQPQDDVALSEKFGHWAGIYIKHFYGLFNNFFSRITCCFSTSLCMLLALKYTMGNVKKKRFIRIYGYSVSVIGSSIDFIFRIALFVPLLHMHTNWTKKPKERKKNWQQQQNPVSEVC